MWKLAGDSEAGKLLGSEALIKAGADQQMQETSLLLELL
jgi:hypothetical protein